MSIPIALVFPPQWELRYPHLAIPSLTAYLSQLGIKVRQFDANLWFIYALLSSETLTTLAEQLENKECSNELQKKKKLYLSMADIMIDRVQKILEQNVKGKQIQDKDSVYLNLAFDFVSSVFSPTKITFMNCEMPYSIQSVEEILSAAKDSLLNPFYSLFKEKFIRDLLQIDPSIVGISVTSVTQLIPAVTLATLLKQEAPHVHVTLGGNVLSRFADEPIRFAKLFKIADSIVLFDGEPALPVLVERVEAGRSLDDVPNLVTCPEGRVYKSPHTVFADVNELPPPTFREFDLDKYFFPKPVLSLLTGRGCYWHRCAFCVIPHGYGKTYRVRNIDLIANDLEKLSKDYNVDIFHFPDESIAPHRLDRLCDALLHHGLDILWMTFARAESGFTPELLKKLYNAGCRVLAFGLESGCQRVLDFMNKGTRVDCASRILKYSADAGIWNHVSFFFGFPTETKEEARKTIQFAVEHHDVIDSVSDSVFQLDYQSPVYCHPEKYGVKWIQRPDCELALTFDYSVMRGMSNEEAQKVRDEFQRLKKQYWMGRTLEHSIHQIIFQEDHN